MGGARNLDPIGVKAIWDGSQFVRGAQQYNAALDKATKAGENFAAQAVRSGRVSADAFDAYAKRARQDMQTAGKATRQQMAAYDQFAKTASRRMREAEQANVGYIKSAIDVQTTLQSVQRTAQQFGEALRAGAASTAVRQSFDSLAKASGVAATELINNMKRASRGTVSELELIRIANRAMLAGGAEFAQELPRLFEIARAASVATGQDIGYVFDTLTRGIAKASPLLIDNAEIYIKVGQAVDKYAATLGKSKDELTAQERQVATLNAVLDEGAEFIEKVGSDTEVATDAFDRWNATMTDAVRDTTEFLNKALGPLGPAISAAATALQTLIPLLQTYILLTRTSAGVSAAGGASGLIGGLKALASRDAGGLIGLATRPIGAGVAGVAAGVAIYEKAIRKIDSTLPSTGETVSKFGKITGWVTRNLISGRAAADDWMRSQVGLPTLAEASAAALERQAQALSESATYREYLDNITRINAELGEGELVTAAMTRAQYEFKKAIEESEQPLLTYAQLVQESDVALARMIGRSAEPYIQQYYDLQDAQEAHARASLEQGEALKVVTDALGALDLEADKYTQKQNELLVITGQVTEEQLRTTETLKLMTEGFAMGVVSAEALNRAMIEAEAGTLRMDEATRHLIQTLKTIQFMSDLADQLREAKASEQEVIEAGNARIEDAEAKHQRKMIDIARKAAQQRADAARDYSNAIADAERERQKDQISAARQHAQRLLDIERDYQRRIRDIEQQYSRTVREAAAERDALAILKARERRADELQDAREARDDARSDEAVNFEEQKRQAEEAYREQLAAAKRAYQERLAEIARALAEEQLKENQAFAIKMRTIIQQNQQELAEQAAQYVRLETALREHLQRMGQIRAQYGSFGALGAGGDTGSIYPAQKGFDGVLTGPATVKVEPGVTEYIYASGDLNRGGGAGGGYPIMPGPAQNQATAINAMVRGGVSVGLQGFSDQLVQRIGPQLVDMVGQSTVDVLTEAFLQAQRF